MAIPTVLFVDDDEDDIFIVQEIIKTSSIDAACIFLKNGREVLSHLRNGNHLPDLIVMDLHMPKMDGYSCLGHLKSDDNFKEIPVIIYSTSSSPVEAASCAALGATSFITKPARVSSIEHIILTLLSNLPDKLTEAVSILGRQSLPDIIGTIKSAD